MRQAINSGMQVLALAAASAAGLAAAGGAAAQSAGQWTVKAGIAKVTPKVDSGDVSAPALPGTRSDVGPDTKPIASIAYGLTDKVSVDLELGMPFKHKLYGAGAIAGTGQLGTVKALPLTALVQYRFFRPDAQFRPYVGIGATFAWFADETGSGALTAISDIGGPPTTFKVKHKLALGIQLGLVMNINERWFADFSYLKARLKTDVNYSSGQFQQIALDPQAVSIGLGVKF